MQLRKTPAVESDAAARGPGAPPPRPRPLPRRRRSPGVHLAALAPVVVAVTVAAGCGTDDTPSMLDPASRAGERVEWLWWALLWASTVAVVVVTVFLLVAVRRRRRDPGLGEVDTRPVPWGDRFIVLAGVVGTGLVLAASFVVTLVVLDDLAAPSEEEALRIDVVGHNWWWELRYPDGAVSANEIHIPVGRPVEVRLPTADVIHSFWVPKLQVKEDNLPGIVNSLWLEADRAGRFRGQCAEFCGLQHANMRFLVEAQPPGEFREWLADQARPADEPARGPAGDQARRGRRLLETSSCAGCHTVRGTSADGELGPDLTHLASRRTIGAGLLPLTRDNLTTFVANAQEDKPGASMPPAELTPDQVDAVVAYLMELE